MTALKFTDAAGKNYPCILLRFALLKANYRAPSDQVAIKFITKSDIDSLGKKLISNSLHAEEVLRQCRQVVLDLGADVVDTVRVKTFGTLDVNMIRFLLGKQTMSSVKYESIEAIACAFVQDLQSSVSKSIDNPWIHYTRDAPATTSTSSVHSMKSYSVEGKLLSASDCSVVLKENSYCIGDKVIHKSTKTAYVIKECSEQSVKLVGDGTEVDVQIDKFLAAHSKYVRKLFPLTPKEKAESNASFQVASMRSCIAFALASLQANVGTPNVEVQALPSKGVFACDNFTKGSLTLVPATMSIQTVLKGTDLPPIVAKVQGFKDAVFSLSPQPMNLDVEKKPITVPFWAVQTTTDENAANVALSSINVDMKTTIAKPTKYGVVTYVTVPVYVNTKLVKPGAELLVLTQEDGTAKKKVRVQ